MKLGHCLRSADDSKMAFSCSEKAAKSLLESHLLTGLVVSFWLILVGVGMHFVWRHAATPGISAAPPAEWPRESRIVPRKGSATLVMLAHPRCACTRASLRELSVLMTALKGKLSAYVLFLEPEGESSAFAATEIRRAAEEIPGVTTLFDRGGVEARLFRAKTSGQVVFYDSEGRLRFSGGITGARGHEGDNDGRRSIVSFVRRGEREQKDSPVFGCALFDAWDSL